MVPDKSLGSPGEGNEWHHIVEQCQSYKQRMRTSISNLIPIAKKKVAGSTLSKCQIYLTFDPVFTNESLKC